VQGNANKKYNTSSQLNVRCIW